MNQIERLLPVIASYGTWILAALLTLSILGVWRLGRGRRFLVPARWPGRLAAGGLLGAALVAAGGLFLVLGPMRPVLDQVRYVRSIVNRPAEDAVFREVGSDAVHHLSELRGRVVLLNLWATWCPPCRHELPDIDRLQKAHEGDGLTVVTVSTEERQVLQTFAAQHPFGTLNVYTPRIDWLDVPGRPLSLVIDRDGIVRGVFVGARSYGEFEPAIEPWIRKHS